MIFNTRYLNRTPNKTPRKTGGFVPTFVVLHETAGYGTLEWNLRPDVKASFNYLVDRGGTVWHYVDEQAFIAWHAGIGPAYAPYNGRAQHILAGTTYRGDGINSYSIGVELEGKADGTPFTSLQLDATVRLMRHFRDVYGIPILSGYYVAHKAVAPTYRSDPVGISVAALLGMAQPATPTDATVIYGDLPTTFEQFQRSLTRHAVRWSDDERKRAYTFAGDFGIDQAFALAVAHKESNFGKSLLAQQTSGWFNLKEPDGSWRYTARYNKQLWRAYRDDTGLLSWFDWCHHIKNQYANAGITTVQTIVTAYAPPSENNTAQYIADVLGDMAYIWTH